MSDSRTYSLSKFTKKIERQTKIIFFLATLLISFFLVYVLRDDAFTATQDYTMFLLFVSIGLWITEAIPPIIKPTRIASGPIAVFVKVKGRHQSLV